VWLAAAVLLVQTPDPAVEHDARARAGFARLSEAKQAEAIEYLRAELSYEKGLRGLLVEHVMKASEVDPGFYPLRAATEPFDPALHASAQPIPRKLLAGDAPLAKAMAEKVFGPADRSAALLDWDYDWGAGEPRRLVVRAPASEVFENLLRGYHPDFGLVRALVLARIDDASERRTLAAFARPYTDREGNVYPGISLYDAWRSGVEIEMPDVDTLGIVHEVLDDWVRWSAPVPPRAQDPLYDAIGELFVRARRFRGLREALAEVYLAAAPPSRDGYRDSDLRFHALWDVCGSDPAALARRLDASEGWSQFLEDWLLECQRDPSLYERGRTRQAVLAEDAARAKALLERILTELGAFGAQSTPAETAGDDGGD
jgi:hypothetical protein